MSLERTFGIIKPDAVEAKNVGKIVTVIENSGFVLKGMRFEHLSKEQAEGFYAEHRERPFFGELVTFMTRGPVVLLALECEGAIAKWRAVMGATDPAKAEDGTLRKLFGANVGENAVHGSDSPESAARELKFFFA